MTTVTKVYAQTKPENITVKQLKELQKQCKTKQFNVYVNVTPEIAQQLLEHHNTNNRSISNPQLQKYVRDIKEGRWNINQVDSIAIDRNGNIADGQHRLTAIKEANRSIPTTVVFGVTEDYKMIQGKGRPKSLSDTLAISGIAKYTSDIAASITLMYAFSKNPNKPRSQVTNNAPSDGEKLEFYENNQKSITASFEKVIELGIKSSNRVVTPANAATVHWVISNSSHGKAVADKFLEKLVIGAELKSNDPIMITRNRIINNSGSIREQRRQDDMLGLIFQAFNDWVANKSWNTGKHSPQGTGIPTINGLTKLNGLEIYSPKTKSRAVSKV